MRSVSALLPLLEQVGFSFLVVIADSPQKRELFGRLKVFLTFLAWVAGYILMWFAHPRDGHPFQY